MATQNSIDKKSGNLTVDPGASGDSFVQFDINSTGEFRIGVDDTDDSFRISQGSALGTNDTFVMSDAGERTMPLQSAFLVATTSTVADQTGDGTEYTLSLGTEIFDQGGDFATTTFTAPVSGRYFLSFIIGMGGVTDSDITEALAKIITSNRTYEVIFLNPYPGKRISGSTLCDMDASDTATVSITCSNGTKVVDILGISSGTVRTCFSGHLVC